MGAYLFKFSACLAVFWLVYILLLEHQTMHRFKRYYLLVAIAFALLIPTLTITHYIEPVALDFKVSSMHIPTQHAIVGQPPEQTPFLNLETVLWVLYGLGFLVFAIRFVVNLFKMYKRISANNKIIKRSLIYVFLAEYRIPHSFFKYIFLNKLKFEKNDIPREVLLHEETHAKQLHSLDIIIIELFQVVFWFHPLIYILKHHIKLNHEFLADQAVLEDGIDTKAYQNILLQFSSNTLEYQLSSAINYSSFKKRFTVMKTQTSKTRVWLSSLLLLPIIAILFYNFAEKEYVEKESSEIPYFLELENNLNSEKLTQQKPPTEQDISAYNVWAKKIHTESKVLSDDATFFPPINEKDFIKFSETYHRMSAQQKKQAAEYPFPGLDVKGSEHSFPLATPTEQEKATAKQVAAYNTWAKSINQQMTKAKANNDVNAYPIVKVKDVKKYKAIYDIMTEAQKRVAEPWPSFPPPPPPAPASQNANVKSGPIEINGATYYFTQQKGKTTYYDQYGKVVNINKVPPPPPIPANATPEQQAKMEIATKSYKKAQKASAKVADEITGYTEINGENIYYVSKNGITTYFDKYGKEVKMDNLPPPPPAPAPPPVPESPLDFVIKMAKIDAKFFNEGKSISSNDAIALLKKNPKLNINAHKTDTKQPLVYISKKPMVIDVKDKN